MDSAATAEQWAAVHEAAAAPVLPVPPETVRAPYYWNPWTRLGFRMAFIFFVLVTYLYCNGTLFYTFSTGNTINYVLTIPLNYLAGWLGHHIFGFTQVPNNWVLHQRGDDMSNWVLYQFFIFVAVIGGLAWTAIARLLGSRRTEYRRLNGWLRFFLRLEVGAYMISYGVIKVFPLQMPPVSHAVLNHPTGEINGNLMLYTLIGIQPIYQCIAGLIETFAGTLVLFRRTALAGMLLCVFVMSNVVLYNFFFDVTVKLFALTLLLIEIFLVLPDLQPLYKFLWRHEAAAAAGTWVPYGTGWGTRFYVRTMEVVFIASLLTLIPMVDGILWHQNHVMAQVSSPLLGGWRVDSATPPTGPFRTFQKNVLVTELYIDTANRGDMFSTDDLFWPTMFTLDADKHTIFLSRKSTRSVLYHWEMPDANHLTLTPVPATDVPIPKPPAPPWPDWTGGPVSLIRIPLAKHYPLLDPPFHVPIWGNRMD